MAMTLEQLGPNLTQHSVDEQILILNIRYMFHVSDNLQGCPLRLPPDHKTTESRSLASFSLSIWIPCRETVFKYVP